tara:strand:+ start:193 stop:1029 length:837 start_codon:yes stop_codon:yes gene_type:complete
VINIDKSYNPSTRYDLDVTNDILIYASYPKSPVFYKMLQRLVTFSFKQIYVVYSMPMKPMIDIEKTNILKHPKIHAIRVENIGYDFMKYYTGLVKIKESGQAYSKVWLMNDSFTVMNWNLIAYNYDAVKHTDITGAFLSKQFKNHLQSYMLIMNEKVADFYRSRLSKYPFRPITNKLEKQTLISDLEIGLFNDLIESMDKIDYRPIFQVRNEAWIGNPTINFAAHCGLIKEDLMHICVVWRGRLFKNIDDAIKYDNERFRPLWQAVKERQRVIMHVRK